MKKNPELIDEALEEAEEYCQHLVENLLIRHASVSLSVAESAELLVGEVKLSQRSYKALKKALKRKHVMLASYKETIAYVKTLRIGRVSPSPCGLPGDCMCASSDFKETMSLVLSCKELYSAMRVPTEEQSVRLLKAMHEKYPELYEESLSQRPNHRILLIRETGDNFRGVARQKTEQDSFNIMNLTGLLTSPLGQFVNGIWRGPETRTYLKAHLTSTYRQLDECVRHGLLVTLPDGTEEHYNVLSFLYR